MYNLFSLLVPCTVAQDARDSPHAPRQDPLAPVALRSAQGGESPHAPPLAPVLGPSARELGRRAAHIGGAWGGSSRGAGLGRGLVYPTTAAGGRAIASGAVVRGRRCAMKVRACMHVAHACTMCPDAGIECRHGDACKTQAINIHVIDKMDCSNTRSMGIFGAMVPKEPTTHSVYNFAAHAVRRSMPAPHAWTCAYTCMVMDCSNT